MKESEITLEEYTGNLPRESKAYLEYEKLVKRDKFLIKLEIHGVDNWEHHCNCDDIDQCDCF